MLINTKTQYDENICSPQIIYRIMSFQIKSY